LAKVLPNAEALIRQEFPEREDWRGFRDAASPFFPRK